MSYRIHMNFILVDDEVMKQIGKSFRFAPSHAILICNSPFWMMFDG